MILNMISTATMIKLGKVYSNWMIDVKASNKKLYERAINMVIEITKTKREIVIDVLEKCNYSPKIAIIMIIKNLDVNEAKKLILKHNDKLGEII